MFPDNLYQLKRDYGIPLDLYKTKTTENIETGRKTVTRTKIHIRKAISLPATEMIRTRAAQQFLKASEIEISDRFIILDYNDLPKDFDIEPRDHVIINHHRYEIITVNENEYGTGYMLTARETKGVDKFEVIDGKVKHKLVFVQLVQGETVIV